MADLHTKGWLPYTLRWTLRVTEPITNTGFALEATGDLNGTGRWTFEQDGPEVVISLTESSRPQQAGERTRRAPPISARRVWAPPPTFATVRPGTRRTAAGAASGCCRPVTRHRS